MPFYEYLCDKEAGGCGHTFELNQGITEEPKKKCPKCKKHKLRRLFGSPGLVFKGTGFYVNDYPKQSSE